MRSTQRLLQNESRNEKTCFYPYANNKGADQRRRSLISAFVVRCLDGIIPLVPISKISSFYLGSAAAQAGLSLPWSQTPKTGFSRDEAAYVQYVYNMYMQNIHGIQ